MWGWPEFSPDVVDTLTESLPAVVAAKMGKVVADSASRMPLDFFALERKVSVDKRGVVGRGGGARTLFEFDPEQSEALILQEKEPSIDPAIRNHLFSKLVLSFRNDLEVGSRNRNLRVVSAGASKSVTTFLSEIHANAFQHGRWRAPGNATPGMRFVRMRKHIFGGSSDAVSRAQGIEPLQKFIDTFVSGAGGHALVEASVSDFGPGIVTHFRSSSLGAKYREVNDGELLSKILTEQISAKGSDPGAGLGIKNALKAVKDMSGFVSLRTGAHWLYQSFSRADAPLHLVNMLSGDLGEVAGTHWQFFWHQPL